jgi:hypothetical protein
MDKPRISIDFDGTVCVQGPFIANHIILDTPIAGAQEALRTLSNYFHVVIFSVRAATDGGREAIADWMHKYDIPYSTITAVKQGCVFYLDNRAIRFNGSWTDALHQIATFDAEEPQQ